MLEASIHMRCSKRECMAMRSREREYLMQLAKLVINELQLQLSDDLEWLCARLASKYYAASYADMQCGERHCLSMKIVSETTCETARKEWLCNEQDCRCIETMVVRPERSALQ